MCLLQFVEPCHATLLVHTLIASIQLRCFAVVSHHPNALTAVTIHPTLLEGKQPNYNVYIRQSSSGIEPNPASPQSPQARN